MSNKWMDIGNAPPAPSKYNNVEAIVIGDLHFSAKPPIARSIEKDWYAMQDAALKQLAEAQDRYGNAVVLCTGDIFHNALSSNELVNFLLPRIQDKWYSVAGNHDLLFHSLEDIRKTAFWTLVESGKVILLQPDQPMSLNGLLVYGFSHGQEIKPPSESHSLMLNVAVVHHYIWTEGKEFKDAPKSHHVLKLKKKLKGYDFAFFGDNHKAFRETFVDDKLTIINVGAFQRRRIDERELRPSMWLLQTDQKVIRRKLNVAHDVFLDNVTESEAESLGDFEEFAAELENAEGVRFDFGEAVKQYVLKHGVKGRLKRVLLKAIEGDKP